MYRIEKITIQDKEYPELLKKISEPPEKLYFKGKLLPKENCFAIVGTRLCSNYGKQIALEIGGDLATAGLTIVSGLATGIDTFSHLAAVERGRRTIAVLGTGLDEKSTYPQSNLKLIKKILEIGGCLISEYPPGTHGTKFTFPERNRIIAGMSLGVLVIEAKQKSGALITAMWTKKQGKKVFAIPGPVHSSNSKGCHYLIKKGAKLTENANDILKELKLPQKSTRTVLVEGENEEETLILEVLKEGPLYIDKIIEKTKLSASSTASTVSVLEIKNKVRNLGGNTFALIR
ncbi:MAG: DNA-processing protein DprA [Candidatus Nealsonbacteria bacterium]|nr:MAG: DNA-protecting protein DprA [Candidatus Nealsonbacteria bacterium]